MCTGNCTQGRRCNCAANTTPAANRPDFLDPLSLYEAIALAGVLVAGATIMGVGVYTIGAWLIARVAA